MDPVSIALKGVGTAYQICRDICILTNGMKKAPTDIERIVKAMQSFCSVLENLENVMTAGRQLLLDGVATQQLDHIAQLVEDNLESLKEMKLVVQDFVTVDGKAKVSILKKLKWQFAKDNVHHMLQHLKTLKMGLNVALSSLNLYVPVMNAIFYIDLQNPDSLRCG